MDKLKEFLIKIVKEDKIKSSSQDYKKIFFVNNELAKARNPNEQRKNLINAFLWGDKAIKFIQYFIEKLHPEEIALAKKERKNRTYFINKEYTKTVKTTQVFSELKRLYDESDEVVFGVRLKIKGNYYSFTNTGHERELEFSKELVESVMEVR